MNLLRPSITTVLQHRIMVARTDVLSLYSTLHRKAHPLLNFYKIWPKYTNSYNSKTHVIRTNFESPRGFELYEFNCSFQRVISKPA